MARDRAQFRPLISEGPSVLWLYGTCRDSQADATRAPWGNCEHIQIILPQRVIPS
jgi:hypothetical protein